MATRLRLVALFLCVFAFVTARVDAVLAGKPTPPPFAVKYRIQLLTHPAGLGVNTSLSRINVAGIAFGGGGAGCNLYLFDAETGGVCWDISQLIPDGLIAEGTTFSAAAISDLGKITGTIYLPDGKRWAYVIDTHNCLTPGQSSITIIDNSLLPGTSGSRGCGINDLGDLLGLYYDVATGVHHLFIYDMNTQMYRRFDGVDLPDLRVSNTSDLRFVPQLNRVGQVAGQLESGEGFRFTPGRSTHRRIFPQRRRMPIETVNGLNDFGVVSGTMPAPKSIRGGFFCPYRCYPVDNIPRPLTDIKNFWVHGVRINSSCDLKVMQGMDPAIYHDTSRNLFIIEDLVVVAEQDRSLWESRDLEWGFTVNEMTDRVPGESTTPPPEDKQVGRLCGAIGFDTATGKNRATAWIGVVLTPEYPPI